MAGTKAQRGLGPVAVIECTEDIPCDPCTTCCTQKAITFEGSINSLPTLNAEACTGCGICVAKCPGMAIFVVDADYSDTEGLVSFAHEFLPPPQVGQQVEATDRKGQTVCTGVVHKVVNPASFDSTAVVTIRVPKNAVDQVRGMKTGD